MDGTQFDTLIKRLSGTRLTRARALQGLAAGAVTALAGAHFRADDVSADDNQTRKRKVCLCASADPATCQTRKVKAKKARRLARQGCNYKGSCQSGVSGCTAPVPVGCSPANNTQGNCQTGQVCNTRAICVTAVGCLNTANPQCGTNQICCPSESASAGECRGTLQAC